MSTSAPAAPTTSTSTRSSTQLAIEKAALPTAISNGKQVPVAAWSNLADHWELSYVYAFITRFTTLVDPTGNELVDITSLERALLDSSPPPGTTLFGPPPGSKSATTASASSSTSAPAPAPTTNGHSNGTPADEEPTTPAPEGDYSAPPPPAPGAPKPPPIDDRIIPPSSELLIKVLKVFIAELHLPEFENSHGRRDWFSWIVRFVNRRLNEQASRPGVEKSFKWERNYFRRQGVKSGSERETEWWVLPWQHKVHVMRQMVDYQLMYAPKIRKMIDEHYDLGKQRVSKRDPSVNPLILSPLGVHARQSIYSLDTTPRLYSHYHSGNSPTLKFIGPPLWKRLTSTSEEYQTFMFSLTEPEKEIPEEERPKPAKKKKVVVEKSQNELNREREQILRKELEGKFEEVQIVEGMINHNSAKRQRAVERIQNRRSAAASLAALPSSHLASGTSTPTAELNPANFTNRQWAKMEAIRIEKEAKEEEERLRRAERVRLGLPEEEVVVEGKKRGKRGRPSAAVVAAEAETGSVKVDDGEGIKTEGSEKAEESSTSVTNASPRGVGGKRQKRNSVGLGGGEKSGGYSPAPSAVTGERRSSRMSIKRGDVEDVPFYVPSEVVENGSTTTAETETNGVKKEEEKVEEVKPEGEEVKMEGVETTTTA